MASDACRTGCGGSPEQVCGWGERGLPSNRAERVRPVASTGVGSGAATSTWRGSRFPSLQLQRKRIGPGQCTIDAASAAGSEWGRFGVEGGLCCVLFQDVPMFQENHGTKSTGGSESFFLPRRQILKKMGRNRFPNDRPLCSRNIGTDTPPTLDRVGSSPRRV